MGRRKSAESEITTAQKAANDRLVLAFGHLQGAANRLEYLLGRALEEGCGINHVTFEVLMILGRAGPEGLPMRSIGQERVLSTGGASRLVDRMEAAGLVIRSADASDRRGCRVSLTAAGEETAVRAARIHAKNVHGFFLEPLPTEHRAQFIEDLRILSHSARDALPRLR
jgi:DNA-binding MarR family transcriptional regulator